ncbi:hypothetical protein C8R45DRAFT_1115758 [Mycena sanguinolenta]|nr:hypothetical protein C8R45DRAFT_1115758 [Mycena sanguinolenta]
MGLSKLRLANACLGLERRTLRSGKEFSAFDLAVGPPVPLQGFFSVADCLRERLEAQQVTQILDEPMDNLPTFPYSAPLSPPQPSDLPPPPTANIPALLSRDQPAHLLTATERKKLGSKRRKREKREREQAESSDPGLKSVPVDRRNAAKRNVVQTNGDTKALPHTKRAWIGKLLSEDGSESPNVSPPPPDSLPAAGMVPHSYTQEDVNRLSGTTGFLYVPWGGEITVPLADSNQSVVGLLGGKPRDLNGWKIVTDGAAALMASLAVHGHFTTDDWHHRRADPETPSQLFLGACLTAGDNSGRRIVGFTNCLVLVFAPILFAFCQSQMALLADWDRTLRWPFKDSIFAACTFNFGPRVSTLPHLDFGNLAWGWCAITALGSFDADRGGHLILWDLKMVIRFPAGATILIPSAIIRHSNVSVQPHESRSSFVQYTAGGLYRWIRNGFRTDEDFDRSASNEEKAVKEQEAKRRWEEGVAMFSTVEDL